jgi:hypothetical protein
MRLTAKNGYRISDSNTHIGPFMERPIRHWPGIWPPSSVSGVSAILDSTASAQVIAPGSGPTHEKPEAERYAGSSNYETLLALRRTTIFKLRLVFAERA